MAGERLGVAWVDTGAGQVRDERVPEGVEVHHPATVVLVFNVNGGQVDPDHLGPVALAGPLARSSGDTILN